MPLWFFPALIGVCAIISLLAGIWLVLHLRDVAGLFSGRRDGEMVRGPGRQDASRAKVWALILVFNAGWIASVLIWVFAIGGDANVVTDASV